MPRLRTPVRGGALRRGGILSYPPESLHREVAYIAYHFHWGKDAIMEMAHPERGQWVKEIAHINRQANGEGDE